MSARELRALGIDTTTNLDASTEDRSATLTMANQPAPLPEVFGLNPYAANINPATSDGAKYYMKATEELPPKEKLKVSITNGPTVKNHFENCRSKHAWGLLLSKIPNDDGVLKDIIKNYRAITKDNVLAFNNTYLGNGLLEPPPAEQLLLDLAPATDAAHKQQFYKRVRSQMIAQAIQGRLDQASLNKLMTVKKFFAWHDSNGDMFFDGVMMLCLVMVECNPETKVGVQVLRDKISNTKSAMFDHDISRMMEHIASTMILITDQGETHDNLMKDSFNALLTVPNTEFHQCFSLEMMGWQGGTKVYTYEDLAEMAKTIYNNMVTTGTWDAVDSKDARIMALTTQLEVLSKSTSPKSVPSQPTYDIPAWRKTKGELTIERDRQTWYWCQYHQKGQGLYVRHKPADCNNMRRVKRREKTAREPDRETETPESSDRKMTLSKEMKAALLTLGTFTEEQADAIVAETRGNLPADF